MGLSAGFAASHTAEAAPWPVDDDLKITDVRVVQTRPKNPFPRYEPTPGSYWTTREAARPIEMHPEYTGKRGLGSKWMPERSLGGVTVEISTNKGLKGYGRGDRPPARSSSRRLRDSCLARTHSTLRSSGT